MEFPQHRVCPFAPPDDERELRAAAVTGRAAL